MRDQPYKVSWTRDLPELRGFWEGPVWRQARPLDVNFVRPEGSDHRPRTQCKLLYNEQNIVGIFRVEDQYVQCSHTQFQSDVWKDSCVEWFVQPKEGLGYFNFEFNCGGTLLSSYVTNPERIEGRLKQSISLTPDDDREIRRFASLPSIVVPEITRPLVWILEFSLPFAVLEKYVGPLGAVKEQIWRANFYKCGNETSHPHWLSWTPLSARNFHDPASFGNLEFDGQCSPLAGTGGGNF